MRKPPFHLHPAQHFNRPIEQCNRFDIKVTTPIFVGIFFDGTGNNMSLDYHILPPERRKHSNIVKLYQTHRSEPSEGYFSHYIPGVGTEFDKIGDHTQPNDRINLGSVGAEKAENRIIWAFTRLLNAPYQFQNPSNPIRPIYRPYELSDLIREPHELSSPKNLMSEAEAKELSSDLASVFTRPSIRRATIKDWQAKLQSNLEGRKPRQVSRIFLSVFGFSRGAAQARAFVNWLLEACTPKGGEFTFAGIPITVQFLGIFDTVASVGIANTLDNDVFLGHQSWADNALQIHPAVRKCVHYIAGHEVRASFPLDSVLIAGQAQRNSVEEKMYPGSHSDVGGGYAPGALGVSPRPQDLISIIPGVDMYHEACKAGVPLLPWHALNEEYQNALTPAPEALAAFNAYHKDANVGKGPVEDMHRQHMALYFSHRFRHRHNFLFRKPYINASSEHKRYLLKTQTDLMRNVDIGLTLKSDIKIPQLARAVQFAHGRPDSLNIWNRASDVALSLRVHRLTPSIEFFFENYIHDSMAGFMERKMDEYSWNRIGLAKFRTILSGND